MTGVFAIFVKFFTNFNSHAHVERDSSFGFMPPLTNHFNSHAHVERDSPIETRSISSSISTHTLTWSVTSLWPAQPCTTLFQLTRSRGAWHHWRIVTAQELKFQLTRSRGAWLSWSVIDLISDIFQLTRSRGAWPFVLSIMTCQSTFQLTRSRGAWRSYHPFYSQTFHFNSHAHVERDI